MECWFVLGSPAYRRAVAEIKTAMDTRERYSADVSARSTSRAWTRMDFSRRVHVNKRTKLSGPLAKVLA
jgi:hypothetical protein